MRWNVASRMTVVAALTGLGGCIIFPDPTITSTASADADAATQPDIGTDAVPEAETDGGDVPFSCSTCAFGCYDGACIDVVSVSSGGDSSCVTTSDGGLYCWGQQDKGQVPLGIVVNSKARPTRIVAASAFDGVRVGRHHGCLTTPEGDVRYWGGRRQNRIPLLVDDLPVAQKGVDAGMWDSNCAWDDSSITCWGAHLDGHDSDNYASASPLPLPLPVDGLPPSAGVVDVRVGRLHACALLASGDVYCWGDDHLEQLGTVETQDRLNATPVLAVLDGRVSAIAAGLAHTCALVDDGAEVHCWGDNRSRQAGQLTAEVVNVPTPVAFPDDVAPWIQITAGNTFSCALNQAGDVWCWGDNGRGQLGRSSQGGLLGPAKVPGLAATTMIDAGAEHMCASDRFGGVWCWGDNRRGQLGDGGDVGMSTTAPQQVRFNDAVSGLQPCDDVGSLRPNACQICAPVDDGAVYVPCPFGCNDSRCTRTVDVASGATHTCALQDDGGVWCWGFNRHGEFGDGTSSLASDLPATKAGLQGADAVVATQHGVCASTSGDVWCWGRNEYGQAGVGSEAGEILTPTQLTLPADVKQGELAAGSKSVCAILEDDTVACWGWAMNGQILGGKDKDISPRLIDGVPPGPLTHLTVSATLACVVARRAPEDDLLYCWGTDIRHRFATGLEHATAVPEMVHVAPNISSVANGSGHLCVLSGPDHETVECWGSNKEGQLAAVAEFGGAQTSFAPTLDVSQTMPEGLTTLSASPGGLTTCAEATDGVYCWGASRLSASGWDFFAQPSPTPHRVPGVTGTPIGGQCAIDASGFLRCWTQRLYSESGRYAFGLHAGYPIPETPTLVGRFSD